MKLRFALILIMTLSAVIVNAGLPDKADDVTTHLEFMGYTVENNDDDYLKARHDSHLNMILKKFRGGILLKAYMTGSSYAVTHYDDFCELVNELNLNASAARYYIDSDIDLVVEGYYPGVYDRTSFGIYMEAFNLAEKELADKYDDLDRFLE
ncbi:MAG: hypothetical protein ISR91_00010 [Candidatus Delongbacteria bacterium]|nr:hypothetical protein [Candidatus Delongbacteria bacterium]